MLEGAKGTGKTETARQFANSAVYLDTDPQVKQLLDVDPALVLNGERPRLLDEWQVAPTLWNYVRRAVDNSGASGEFILTGSAQPIDDKTRHSGAGRFSRLRMRPFTMLESGQAHAAVSLTKLFDSATARAPESVVSFQEVLERMVHGGFPGARNLSINEAMQFHNDYLDQISRLNIPGSGLPDYDPVRIRALLSSIARNVASEVRIATLAQDIQGFESDVARSTVMQYISALKRIFLLEEQPAWAPALRSRARLRNSPKLHLVDVALAIAALRTNVQGLLADLNTLGLLFESFVFQHLLVYSAPIGGTVFHYRDSNGLEADAVIELRDGSWMAFQVKLGAGHIDQAAHSLLRLAAEVKKRTTSSTGGSRSNWVCVHPQRWRAGGTTDPTRAVALTPAWSFRRDLRCKTALRRAGGAACHLAPHSQTLPEFG